MKLNGQNTVLPSPVSLLQFLSEQKYDTTKIAVELNGNIVSRSNFEKMTLKDEDEVEIVCFVGGG